uniref:uncharacterized protein LOC120337199 n=1 Tax=Styela clava TaxID=7725 RepID=UPI00193A8644|nr:uncharacterized protein LOC120337199 [Styela clava]
MSFLNICIINDNFQIISGLVDQRQNFEGRANKFVRYFNKRTWERTRLNITESYHKQKLSEPEFQVFPQLRIVNQFYSGQMAPGDTKYRPEIDFIHTQLGLFKDSNLGKEISVNKLFEHLGDPSCRRVALVGSAGSGKTVALKRLAENVVVINNLLKNTNPDVGSLFKKGNKSKYRFKFVHYLDLRKLPVLYATRPEEALDPCDLLFGQFAPTLENIEVREGYIWTQKHQSECIFFLDGLDEVSWNLEKNYNKMTYTDKSSTATIMYNFLSRNLFPDATLVISSREYGIASLPYELRPQMVIALAGLDQEDIKRLFIAVSGESGEESWNKFTVQSPSLVQFLRVPLFLIFNAIVLKFNPQNLPDITDVMIQILRIFFRSSHARISRNINQYIHKLMGMSFEGIKEKRVIFTIGDLQKFGLHSDEVRNLIIKVPGYKILFNQHLMEGDVLMHFSHQIFQELLACLYIANMDLDIFQSFVTTEIHSDHWAVVLKFLCGIILNENTATEFIKELIEVSSLASKKEILRHKIESLFNHATRFQQIVELYNTLNESKDIEFIRALVKNITFEREIFTEYGMHAVSSVMRHCNYLQIIRLIDCSLNENVLEVMRRNLCSSNLKVERFDVSRNQLNEQSCTILGSSLQECSVKELIMQNCNLTDKKLEALSGFDSLKIFDIGHNDLSKVSMKSLKNFILENNVKTLITDTRHLRQECLDDLKQTTKVVETGVMQKKNHNILPGPEKEKYTKLLQIGSSKSERMKIFTEMHAVGEALSDTIASSVQAIDMSNVTLTYNDIPALGFIISHSTTLSMVNFSNCRLPPNSIARLGFSIKSNVVIHELNIEKNYNLNVEDFIAGVKLCIREGRECNFICDVAQLTKKDKKVFKAVVLQYTETSPSQSARSRRVLAMESRLQIPQVPLRRYKKHTGKSYSIRHQRKAVEEKSQKATYSTSQLQPSKTDQTTTDPRIVAHTENTDKREEEPLETFSDATVSTNRYSTQPKRTKKNVTKYKPKTVAESVKYRKMQRYQSILSTLEEEISETLFHSKLDKSVKIAALASDRTRFHVLANKTTKSAGLRRHVENTHSMVSSMRKSTNKDSGIKSFSHFSSAASKKSIHRKYSGLRTRISTDSARGSFGSSENFDILKKNNDHDPKVVGHQSFEMTCKYGLGVVESKTEQIERWLNKKQSQKFELPPEEDFVKGSEQGHIDLLEMKLDNALRRPEVVYATIGEKGGEVRISSFKIYFPHGAVKEEKEFFFKSCSFPDEQQSEGFFPITPVLTCRLINEPHRLKDDTILPFTFHKSVKITMRTFCSPKCVNVPVIVSVFHTNEKGKGGRQVRSHETILGRLGVIDIEVKDFCKFEPSIPNEQLKNIKFSLKNNISFENTERVISYFWKEEKNITANDLGSSGSPIATGFPLPVEIIISQDSTIKLSMNCKYPNETEVEPLDRSFKFAEDLLIQKYHMVFFELKKVTHKSCKLKIDYTLRAIDSYQKSRTRGPLPIFVEWPIKQNGK